MTRFELLALLAGQNEAISCNRIAEISGQRSWYRRSFRASLASRLRRLRRWGLVRRRLAPYLRPAHARTGIYLWRISSRGRKRLQWARSAGKL